MTEKEIKDLFAIFLNDACSENEVSMLMQECNTGNNIELLQELVYQQLGETPIITGQYSNEVEQVYGQIKKHIKSTVRKQSVLSLWKKVAVAASVFFFVGIGALGFLARKEKKSTSITTIQKADVDFKPGGQKALLRLADGSTVVLDSAQNGTLANQGNTSITKLSNGQLIYSSNDKSGEMLYNSVITPQGGTYQITLSDGTKVWLNAASSLRFPTVFKGTRREVEVGGEAYFEVAHNASMPFIVKNGNAIIKVLGTHFNVNSYKDENDIKITLLEGKVKISSADEKRSLDINPGQQAVVNPSGDNLSVNDDVDIESIMAWKNDLFYFNNADIKTIMRQLGRWYNIETEYEGAVPQREFSGKISRNTNASNVLKILEHSGIHFRMEDKKIIVTS